MAQKVCSHLIDIWCPATSKGRCGPVMMKYTHPWQSMNSKIIKLGLSKELLRDFLDVSSTGSTLPKEQFSDSHLHPMKTVEVFLKLERYYIWYLHLLHTIYIRYYYSKIFWSLVATKSAADSCSGKCLATTGYNSLLEGLSETELQDLPYPQSLFVDVLVFSFKAKNLFCF